MWSKQSEEVLSQESQEDVRVTAERSTGIEARFHCVDMQARIFACEFEGRRKSALLGCGISVIANRLRAAWRPLAARAGLRRYVTPSAKTRHLGGLALGILYARGDKDDVRAVGKMRHERLAQHEGSE